MKRISSAHFHLRFKPLCRIAPYQNRFKSMNWEINLVYHKYENFHDIWKLENEANPTESAKYLWMNGKEENPPIDSVWCYFTAFGTYARHNRHLYCRTAELFDGHARKSFRLIPYANTLVRPASLLLSAPSSPLFFSSPSISQFLSSYSETLKFQCLFFSF